MQVDNLEESHIKEFQADCLPMFAGKSMGPSSNLFLQLFLFLLLYERNVDN